MMLSSKMMRSSSAPALRASSLHQSSSINVSSSSLLRSAHGAGGSILPSEFQPSRITGTGSGHGVGDVGEGGGSSVAIGTGRIPPSPQATFRLRSRRSESGINVLHVRPSTVHVQRARNLRVIGEITDKRYENEAPAESLPRLPRRSWKRHSTGIIYNP